jgi:hypothetical protein
VSQAVKVDRATLADLLAAVPNVLAGHAESLVRVPYASMEVLEPPKSK